MESHDVVVIGGGDAGSVLGVRLADAVAGLRLARRIAASDALSGWLGAEECDCLSGTSQD
jgi:pyruvate/2-oxoglutarate dehydrogenase complex dihydrolipoamide dehydrogenase (E3) component